MLRTGSLLVFTAAFLVMSLASCATKKPSRFTVKFGPAELKEDAEVFSRVMLAMHPGIGIYKARSYYDVLFDSLISSNRDSLTEKEFRIKLKLAADELRCGHTEVLYSKEYYREIENVRLNYSPYVFIPVKDKVYMIANIGKNKDSLFKRGAEVTHINGVGVDSMLRYAKRFLSSDGYVLSSREHYMRLAFNSYFVALFGRPDTFTVNYIVNKKPGVARYAAFKQKSFPTLVLGPKEDSLFVRYKRAGMRYRYIDSAGTVMQLKVERFSNVAFRKAYRRVFRKLKRRGSEHLVLDLRNNGGGNLTNAYRLLSYLEDTAATQTLRTAITNYPYPQYTSGNFIFKLTRFAFKIIGKKSRVDSMDNFTYTIRPRKRFHFYGKVYVLINGGSFSASSLVAAYLKQRQNTVFIGEETGGTMEGCNAGVTPYYVLPNTGLRVRTPAFRIVHDVCPVITGRGVMPDYPVEYKLDDLLNRRDLEIRKVRELLRIR